jgi:phage/plasmid-like protein (TIGR03299 family)
MREGFATVRTDTGEVLGTVGPDYEPVQNRDAFSFFDVLVDKHDAVYETAGILGHGERMWLLAKLPGYMKIHGNDLVNKYLLLTNSHDGRATVRVKLAPIRLVCNNTLTSAVKGAGQRYVRQTTDAPQRADNAVALLGMTGVFFNRLELLFNAMAERTMTEKELHEYVQTLVPDSDHDGDHAATDKVRSAVLELHESGWGAHLARGTVWGAFNSVTEYTDHVMLGDDPAQRLTSIWFGSGEQFKMRAFQLAERFLQA